MRTARIGTWSWSLQDNTADWDASLLTLIGFELEASAPPSVEDVLEFVHPDDRVDLYAAAKYAVRSSEPLNHEFRIIHADGSIRWLLTRAELTVSTDTSPLRLLGACTDITTRKHVEAKLQRVVRTLKAARVATFFWDAVACTVAWEDEARFCFPSVSGMASDVDIEFVLERVHPRDRERVRTAFEGASKSGEPLRLTCMGSLADPCSPKWLEAVVVGAEDAPDGTETLAGAFVDVTDHMELEREATEARRTLQLALAAGEIGTQVWDMQIGRVHTDPVWDRLFGLDSEDKGAGNFQRFLARVDPRDRALVAEGFKRALHSPAGEKWTFRYTRPDGARLWLTASSRTEFDGQGKAWRFISAVADITELKRAEERLMTQSEVSNILARTDSIAEALGAVIALVREAEQLTFGAFWLLDDREQVMRCAALSGDGTVDSAGLVEACRRDTTRPGRGTVGHAWQPSHTEHGSDALDALTEAEALMPIWLAPVVSDGQCIGVLGFHARAPRVHDDVTSLMTFVGEQLAAFVRRRGAEQGLRSLNAELEQRVVERTKELESFSYSVSHDLRAPLRTLDGFSQALSAEYGALIPEEGRHLLREIRNGAVRMSELIDDLLNFSRLGRAPMRKRAFAMMDLVNECLTALQGSHAGRAVKIVVEALPDAAGDRALLRQVWTNLLSNAIKYSSKNPEAEVHVHAETLNGTTVYVVRDNGAGFDMRYVHKLFGVFRRLHRADEFEGTGVGLAIVQRIVQRHGGRIWAEALPGKGATFSFTLEPEAPS